MCALNTGNTVLARQCLNEISLQQVLDTHPETWFLAYRLALKEESNLSPLPDFFGMSECCHEQAKLPVEF